MIIFLNKFRKPWMPPVAKRAGYLDRSSYEEEIRSSQWTRVEHLMQSLNISWSKACRLLSQSAGERREVR